MLKVLFFAFMLVFGTGISAHAGEAEDLASSAQASGDKAQAALFYKKAGDVHSAGGDHKSAGAVYKKALEASRASFTRDERLEMATRMSWGGFFNESIKELRLILDEDPSNRTARVQLARVVAWSGDLDGSLAEVEKVLAIEPGNREAQLVKANVLRWKGDNKAAGAIYNGLLTEREDFDARMGLAYAELSAGHIKEAKKNRDMLKPGSPYQEREYKDLVNAIDSSSRPRFDTRYSYYNDTDYNQVRRYTLSYVFFADGIKSEARYVHTDGHDRARNNDAESLTLSAFSRRERYGLGASLGAHLVGNRDDSKFLTGGARAEIYAYGGVVGASVSKDLLTDTAQLIENGVRSTGYGVYATRPYGKVTLRANADFRTYSDGNSAVDLQFVPSYLVKAKGPATTVGYKLRYMDFDRQSGSGFFDPNGFVSNQVFASVEYDEGRFYGYLEPYFGYQSYTRYNESSHDFFGGGAVLAGYRAARHVSIELSAEGGSSAVGTNAGFKYYIAGFKVIINPL